MTDRKGQNKPPSPNDTDIPDAELDLDMETPKIEHKEDQGNKNKQNPREKNKPIAGKYNAEQALMMIYKAIKDTNTKVDSIASEMKKVQAQNAVITKELRQVHQWIGACIKMQGGKGPPNPPLEPAKQ